MRTKNALCEQRLKKKKSASAFDEEGISTVYSLQETEIPKVAPLTIT